jgi:hypothetical protein
MVGERGFETDFSPSSKALILLRSGAACVTVLKTIGKAIEASSERPFRAKKPPQRAKNCSPESGLC